MEFAAKSGLQALLQIPRQSMAGAGVSLCIYYIAHITDVMEKVVQLSSAVLDELVE